MSAWPSDSLPRPVPSELNPERVDAYFLSPSEPVYATIQRLLRAALEAACSQHGLAGDLHRAIDSQSPVVIHDEIWNWLYHADLLVFGITGENGSVMMELGVASAWRLKPQIIVLQNRERERPLPFNLSPARIIKYDLSPEGLVKLQEHALEAFLWSLSTTPVVQLTKYPRETVYPFRYPKHSEHLLSHAQSHRYQRSDGGLEFGAPHDFRSSFLLPNTGPREAVSLHCRMSFAYPDQIRDPSSVWVGFKLLGSGILMNFGVGAVVRGDGTAQVTYQESERGPYKDPFFKTRLTCLAYQRDIIAITAEINERTFTVKVQANDEELHESLDLVGVAKYRPTEGYCLLQAYRCRAILWNLELDDPR